MTWTLKEAIVSGAHALCAYALTTQSRDVTSIAHLYGQVRHLYLQHRIKDLRDLLSTITKYAAKQDDPDLVTVVALTKLRLEIRELAVAEATILELEGKLGHHSLLDAEAYSVLAMAYETLGDDVKAEAAYARSADLFTSEGLSKRAVNASLNRLAARSRIEPHLRLLTEYQTVYRLAIAADEMGTAGTALVNMSREYQLLGSQQAALRDVNEALKLFAIGSFGTLQYYLALCHRCHILIEQGHRGLANVDFDEALVAEFPEVKAALQVLAPRLGRAVNDFTDSKTKLLPTWRERLTSSPQSATTTQHSPLSALGELETRLVDLLREKSRNKHELIDALYAPKGEDSWFAAENRLKQLLHRIRKKCPGLLMCQSGFYSIVDPVTAGGDALPP